MLTNVKKLVNWILNIQFTNLKVYVNTFLPGRKLNPVKSGPLILDKEPELEYGGVWWESIQQMKMCPNCARQGQIFPNNSKRNQKLVEKVV